MTGSDDPLETGGEDPAIAAEFVLRLLGPEEDLAAEARERRDPAFAAEVANWRVGFASLDAETAAMAPSPAVRDAVERRLFGAPQSVWRRAWGSLRFLRVLASVATAGTALVAVLHFTAHRPLFVEERPRLIAVLAPEAAREPQFLALFEPGAAVLNVTRLAGGSRPGRDFELWVVEEGAAPVSLGVLPDEESARVPLGRELAARIATDDALAVSEEPEGGSTSGAPTGGVLAFGSLREL